MFMRIGNQKHVKYGHVIVSKQSGDDGYRPHREIANSLTRLSPKIMHVANIDYVINNNSGSDDN